MSIVSTNDYLLLARDFLRILICLTLIIPLNGLSAMHFILQLNKSSTSNLGQKAESTTPSLNAGVASKPATSASSGPVANMPIFPTAAANPPAGGTSVAGVATATNIEAVRRAQELAARMGFRHDPQFAPIINMFPGQAITPDGTISQKPTKAPVLRLDAQGREIDEHGNVVNLTKPSNLSTLKVRSILNYLFLCKIVVLTLHSLSEDSRSTLINRRRTRLKY